MHAAAINPTDILARNGQIAARQRGFAPPYVPAMDITGTIDQIDPNINRNLKIGQRLWEWSSQQDSMEHTDSK